MPSQGVTLQLLAKGDQDKMMIGNPQNSFFRLLYRRHTNFAIETNQMDVIGFPDFGKVIYFNILRTGDLLGPLFLRFLLPPLTKYGTTTPVSYCNGIGHVLIEEVSVEIGEKEIDRQYGEFMEIWSRLITPESKRVCSDTLIGRTYNYNLESYDTEPSIYPPKSGRILYVPLLFWFCQNPGLALPLLSIPYSPIRIRLKIAPLSVVSRLPIESDNQNNITPVVNPVHLDHVSLWGEYIYLDKEERIRFMESGIQHDYIMTQLQYNGKIDIDEETTRISIPIEFNNPIKEFFLIFQRKKAVEYHEYFNYSNFTIGEYNSYSTDCSGSIPKPLNEIINVYSLRTDLFSNAKLILDGQEHNTFDEAFYFRSIHPYTRHTTVKPSNFIYVYSLALSPEEVQPSGSLNASRIDTVAWQFTMNENIKTTTSSVLSCKYTKGHCTVKIYALNYNLFRVVDGYAGVLFSV